MIDATAEHYHTRPMSKREVPVVVQILGTATFAGFAIVSVIFAFNAWWPAGVLVALVLGWRGNFTSATPASLNVEEIAEQVRALTPQPDRQSGNKSFDTYRAEMMRRLEEEQNQFDGFLMRLRDAKDRSEFDQFLDERAAKARDIDG